MGFLSFLRGDGWEPEKRVSLSDPGHWIIRLTDSLEQSGLDVSGDGAMRLSAVYSCVRVLSESIASLPLLLYERGEEERKTVAREHPLYPLLHESPNNWQTAFEFYEMIMGHLCLRGNAYSFLEKNGTGEILRIVPIHPDRIKIRMKDNKKQVLEYLYQDTAEGEERVFPAEKIWHIRGLSSDGFVGVNPIELSRGVINLTAEAERHGYTYFKNGARTSGFIKHPGRLSDPARARLQNSTADMAGADKFKVFVLEEGLDWQQISLSNEDSQYLESRNFQTQEIARIFRVPPVLIGHPDKSATYASVEQFMISFVQHTIRPWVVRIEQSINKNLLSEADQEKFFSKFKVEGLLRGDTRTRYQAYSLARQARWMSVNEIRALEDMDPIEGGDEYENPAIDVSGLMNDDKNLGGSDDDDNQ